jgi:hypothetical protein
LHRHQCPHQTGRDSAGEVTGKLKSAGVIGHDEYNRINFLVKKQKKHPFLNKVLNYSTQKPSDEIVH